MNSPLKFLIFGSCVSRDILNFITDCETVKLVDYYARSSLGSLAGKPWHRAVNLEKIESKFQRKMVERDLTKEFFHQISYLDFDLLLIDFIDERFKLCFDGDSICTVSNELLHSDFNSNDNALSIVNPFTNEYFQHWEAGWSLLIHKLKEFGLLSKVRLNCAFWAESTAEGSTFEPAFTPKKIEEANAWLNRFYERAKIDLTSDQLVVFDKKLILGNEKHQWGKSPFHYVDQFYLEALRSMVLERDKKNRPFPSFDKMIQVLDQFHQNYSPDRLDSCEFGHRLFESYLKKNLFVREMYSEDTEWLSFFTSEECVKIHSLLLKMQDEEFGFSIAEQALSNAKIFIDSPFTEGREESVCTESLYVFNRNFLRFRDINEIFYIVQHHKSARAVYFPLRRCVIVIDKIALPVESIYALNNEILRLLPYYQSNESVQSEDSFYGLISSYGRPYHFYYDTLPPIYKAQKQGIDLKRIPRIIQFTDEAFLSVRDFLGLQCEENFTSTQTLNEELAKNRAFALKIGYGSKREFNFDELDSSLIDYAHKTVENIQEEFPQYHRNPEVKHWFWFGVCSEKRAWQEQIEGLREIIQRILFIYPDAGFIFDGLTRTMLQTQNEVQISSAQAEMEIFQTLVSELSPSIAVVNLIGASSVEKIAFAEKIDLFVSSYLTDSMYPARIARKKGIGHGALVAAPWDHLHPQTVFIPKKFVTDTNNDTNWSKVSYSIPASIVAETFSDLLSNLERPETFEHTFSFRPFSGIKCKIDHIAGCAIFNVNAKNDIEYIAIDDISLNFKDSGTRQFRVNHLYLYDFYFRLLNQTGNVECSLAVIGYSAQGRCMTDYILLGRNKLIEFPPETINYRMFLRFKGIGQLSLSTLSPVVYRKSATDGLRSTRDLAKWEQKNYEFKNVESFLETDDVFDGIYSIAYPDAFLDMNFYRKQSETLVIFFNAAIGRTSQTVLPAFSGMSAVNTLNANILMLSDPVLYLSPNLSLGWFAGSKYIPLQIDLPKILLKFISCLDAKKVILFGGSGGGFATMYYASFIKNSIAVVANPQTDIFAYDKGSVERYMEAAWFSNNFPKGKNGFESQVAARYFQGSYRLIYMQNINDTHHLNKHLRPFLDQIGRDAILGDFFQLIDERSCLILGNGWGQGHAAPPKNFIFNLLDYIVDQDFDFILLDEFLTKNDRENQRLIDQILLTKTDGKFLAEIIFNERHSLANEHCLMAWYLYKDGQKAVVTPYGNATSYQFDVPAEKGIYWAVGFVRCNDYRESVKSKKIKIEM